MIKHPLPQHTQSINNHSCSHIRIHTHNCTQNQNVSCVCLRARLQFYGRLTKSSNTAAFKYSLSLKEPKRAHFYCIVGFPFRILLTNAFHLLPVITSLCWVQCEFQRQIWNLWSSITYLIITPEWWLCVCVCVLGSAYICNGFLISFRHTVRFFQEKLVY